MSTNAMLGYSTLFKTGNGATPEVFTTVSEVTNITPPSISRDAPDATHEESPDGWREFIGGLKDGGDVSIDMNFDPGGTDIASFLAELDLEGAAAAKNRRIEFPDGSYFAFAAILTGVEPDAPIDDKLALSCTFKVSGKPTLVQA